MSLRTRLLLAFAVIVFIPIALLAFGLRHEMTGQLSQDYEERLQAVVAAVDENLRRESDAIAGRLASLKLALMDDNRFRLPAVAGAGGESDRRYLLDYAERAMRRAGLSMLEIQDADGRIISSGHFRNEYGRVEAGLASALADRAKPVALVVAHTADRDFTALARSDTAVIGGRAFTLVGGVEVDDAFLSRLGGDRAVVVSLRYPGGHLTSSPAGTSRGEPPVAAAGEDAAVKEIAIPLIRTAAGAPLEFQSAALVVTQSRARLHELVRSADSWFLATTAATAATALLLAVWVSSRMTRRLAALADKTAVLDLDRLDVEFDEGTDEVGRLSRLLGDLAARLRTSTVRVREAERRATVGDLARQINHDIKNGLIPLRNVMRHLTQVGRDDPAALAAVLAERRQTVDSSIAYLETLATNYERLSSAPEQRECDLNALIYDVVRGVRGHDRVEVRTELRDTLPRVVGDPVAFRRILENLLANAADSLERRSGRIAISTELLERQDEPRVIRMTVADTGRGMTKEEAAKIFNDFYTTKKGGTGLGLSIVRRLVMDLHGTLRVESEAGVGTRMIIEIPVGGGGAEPGASPVRNARIDDGRSATGG